MWRKLFLVLVLALTNHTISTAQDVGPSRGSLVIVGGAMRDTAIVKRFIELAGGNEAPIVIIPTAGGDTQYDQYYPGIERWKAAGVKHITVVHTLDRTEANDQAFVAPIQNARGVWFPGGRQWRLVDAYLGTRTEIEVKNVLKRGGVVGGSSAGATIQGSYLVRGDTKTNTIMMGDHEEGFGLLKNVAIDQHLLARNRHFDLIPVIEKFPHLLGIGIDENTAIVVQGDQFNVIGQSLVAIYDNQRMLSDTGQFYFLQPGDSYDMSERTPQRRTFSSGPFNLIREESWPTQK